MGFTYTIIFVSVIDRFTGLPIPYGGPSIPAGHRLYLTNNVRWNNQMKEILFGEEAPFTDITPVKDIVEFIQPYDDLVEPLVKASLHLYWTREKHQQFLMAFKFFAEHGFYISCH